MLNMLNVMFEQTTMHILILKELGMKSYDNETCVSYNNYTY